ncbi:MAG TPA: response regulator [Egibacteraceae bacterium]|nr:response regulator [Egibacteraceae bacterium]
MTADSNAPAPFERLRLRADGGWRGYALFGAAAVLLYLVLPWGGRAQALIFAAVQISLIAALTAGIRIHRPERPLIWWLIIAGQGLYAAGNLLWYLLPTLIGQRIWDGTGWLAHWFYIPGYLILLAGLLLLIRARKAGGDGAALIDSLIVTLGVGVVSWVFLMAPYARAPELTLIHRAATLAYPAVDLAIVAVVVAMAFLPGPRKPAFWLLGAALASQLATDTLYAVLSLNGSFVFGAPYFTGWMLLFVLLGTAALHPSMRTLSEHVGSTVPRLGLMRLGFLAASALLPSALLLIQQVQGRHRDVPIIAIVSAVLFLLVLARLARVMEDMSEHQRSQQALAASRDEAVEASRLKSAFLAMMSHEIRTPLNAVIGMTGLLLDTELDDQQRQYVTGVRSGGEALLSIINELLDFSKIEAGKLTLEDGDFRVEQVLEEVADLLGETARAKGVSVFSYCDPEIPRLLRGDVGKLHQVLLNLLSNAVKFTDEGETTIRATLLKVASSVEAVLLFEVTDSGIGISDEDRGRLFQPFVQLDDSTTRRHGGTGLGLAISRQLVELMGGEIGVRSKPGEGSTFWFTARFELSRAVAEPRQLRVLSGRRVLVVDSDPTNRLLLLHQMSAWGMRPSWLSDADTALERLNAARMQGDPIEIVLADLSSPQIDGLGLAAAIAGDESLAGTRIAVLVDHESALQVARSAGVQATLRKPVRQSRLYDVLIGLLVPGRAPQEPVERAADAEQKARHRGHVLLVEDNAANQLVGAAIVRKLGYRVDVVANGQEALEVLALRGYDAVLMDLYMPVMDGYEATREIRQREGQLAHTPIIAMTAGALEEDHRRCLEAGMDEYVTKPVRLEDLGAVLARWVPTSEAPPEADESEPAPADAEAPIDPGRWAVLLDLVGNDSGLLNSIIDTFVEDTPQRVDSLRAAVEAGDDETAKRAVHTLRGSGANLGAVRLAQLCGTLEERAHRGDLTDAASAITEIAAELERVREALKGLALTPSGG